MVIILITVLSCVGCDQLTKSAARMHLVPGEPVSFLGDMIRMDYTENPGAFLSLGATLSAGTRRTLFQYGTALLIGVAFVWVSLSRRLTPLQTLGVALVCGGGLGNLIDRFARGGAVTDFLSVGIGALRTGIFNVADFSVLAGVLLIAASGARRNA